MIDFDVQSVGLRVQEFRKLNGLTAQALADTAGAGLTRAVIANIESGRRQDLSVAHIVAIAWALRVTPLALLFDTREPSQTVKTSDGEKTILELMDWFRGTATFASEPQQVQSHADQAAKERLGSLEAYFEARRHLRRLSAEFKSQAGRPAEEWASLAQERGFWEHMLSIAESSLRNEGINIGMERPDFYG